MKFAFTRLIGIVFVLAAAVGMLFSFYILIKVWQIKPKADTTIRNNLLVAQTTFETTAQGLVDMESTVNSLSANGSSLQTATLQLAQAINDSHPMMDSLIKLVGQDIPDTISTTQTSLKSAQGSATIIDNTLSAVSKIPFLGLGRYEPAVPLHESLAQVSTSLDNLHPSLVQMQYSLSTANSNISIMETQVISISSDIQQVNQSLEKTHTVIRQYREVSNLLLGEIEKIQSRLSGWLSTLAWFLTFLMVWIFITQIGLLLQGLELMGVIRPRYRT